MPQASKLASHWESHCCFLHIPLSWDHGLCHHCLCCCCHHCHHWSGLRSQPSSAGSQIALDVQVCTRRPGQLCGILLVCSSHRSHPVCTCTAARPISSAHTHAPLFHQTLLTKDVQRQNYYEFHDGGSRALIKSRAFCQWDPMWLHIQVMWP